MRLSSDLSVVLGCGAISFANRPLFTAVLANAKNCASHSPTITLGFALADGLAAFCKK